MVWYFLIAVSFYGLPTNISTEIIKEASWAWCFQPKFTSNRKSVLKSVPEKHRKDGVKNRDLHGKLLEEMTLGICWDIERDNASSIWSQRETMTQRWMLPIVSSVYGPLGFVGPFILKDKKLLHLLYQDEIGWDERLDDSIINEWLIWQKSLKNFVMNSTFMKSRDVSTQVDLER